MAPEEESGGISRRSFVKGCVGAATLGAAAATGLSMAASLSAPQEEKAAGFPYLGSKLIRGPAKVGLPIIPVVKNHEGILEGSADFLDWYAFCGHVKAPGLAPDFTADNSFYYFAKPDFRGAWYASFDGQKARASHFKEPWDGASVVWRSQGQKGADIITAMLIRIDPAGFLKPAKATGALGALYDAARETGFVAFVSFCAHACCVPGYKETQLARTEGFFDRIYCTCHGSVYDPRSLDVFDYGDLP